MPTYQYACTECAERLEVQQSFTDEPLANCPACDGRLRKVFNAVGVVFKGSGFYRTDSRASQNGKSDQAAEGTGAKAEGGDKSAANGKDSTASKGSGDKPTGGASTSAAQPSGSTTAGGAKKKSDASS